MSSVLPNWQKYAVHQRRSGTGCIPTAYEMILRYVGVEDVDFDSFQDDFDLDKDNSDGDDSKNNFISVAHAVNNKYPHVCFDHPTFPKADGAKKLELIESKLKSKKPVVVSIPNEAIGSNNGWHIMLVVDDTGDELTLLVKVATDGKPTTRNLPKDELVRIHKEYEGGDDVAYLV